MAGGKGKMNEGKGKGGNGRVKGYGVEGREVKK